MQRISAGTVVGAILIVLLTSISLPPVSARPELVSFGIQEQEDIAKWGITKNSITTPFNHLNLVIQPFHESTRLPVDKVVCDIV